MLLDVLCPIGVLMHYRIYVTTPVPISKFARCKPYIQSNVYSRIMIIPILKCVCLLLFYAIATVFKLFYGSDMMYEMRRKAEPTVLLPQGIFYLPQDIAML